MSTSSPASYGDACALFYDQLYPSIERGLVETLRELAGNGPALELGIATGRVAIPLRRLGVAVHGIEASPAMIAAFRKRPGSADIPVIEGDFASAAPGGRFQLIYSLVSTFSLLTSLERQRACLHNVAAHLAPTGCFVSEISDALSSFPEPDSQEYRIDTPLGMQTYRVSWLGTPLPVIDAMAAGAGLHLAARWSSWARTPWTPAQPRHISVYRLADSARSI
jgi:SAM-dependent methyltransferase